MAVAYFAETMTSLTISLSSRYIQKDAIASSDITKAPSVSKADYDTLT